MTTDDPGTTTDSMRRSGRWRPRIRRPAISSRSTMAALASRGRAVCLGSSSWPRQPWLRVMVALVGGRAARLRGSASDRRIGSRRRRFERRPRPSSTPAPTDVVGLACRCYRRSPTRSRSVTAASTTARSRCAAGTWMAVAIAVPIERIRRQPAADGLLGHLCEWLMQEPRVALRDQRGRQRNQSEGRPGAVAAPRSRRAHGQLGTRRVRALPTQVVMVGHFDDSGAAGCPAAAVQECRDRLRRDDRCGAPDGRTMLSVGAPPSPPSTPAPADAPLGLPGAHRRGGDRHSRRGCRRPRDRRSRLVHGRTQALGCVEDRLGPVTSPLEPNCDDQPDVADARTRKRSAIAGMTSGMPSAPIGPALNPDLDGLDLSWIPAATVTTPIAARRGRDARPFRRSPSLDVPRRGRRRLARTASWSIASGRANGARVADQRPRTRDGAVTASPRRRTKSEIACSRRRRPGRSMPARSSTMRAHAI